MEVKFTHENIDYRFTDDDVVDIGDFIPQGDYNPYNVHPWLLHDHGFTLCVVFASNLQDALDIAADNNKLDAFLIDAEDAESGDITYLGNAGKPFDIDGVLYVELDNPPFSFVALFNACKQEETE